jgi:hypothetical protein
LEAVMECFISAVSSVKTPFIRTCSNLLLSDGHFVHDCLRKLDSLAIVGRSSLAARAREDLVLGGRSPGFLVRRRGAEARRVVDKYLGRTDASIRWGRNIVA